VFLGYVEAPDQKAAEVAAAKAFVLSEVRSDDDDLSSARHSIGYAGTPPGGNSTW
jgi:hypothetical protein